MRAGVDTVLFIHGFNYTLDESLIDAARLMRTHETDDCPYTFFVLSWPSDGSLMPYIAYANDRADVRTSGVARAAAATRRRPGSGRSSAAVACHLMAHSMGAYALRHAVQGVRREIGDDLPRLFDKILPFAPDEDADAFICRIELKGRTQCLTIVVEK